MPEFRTFIKPTLFGNEICSDWRQNILSSGSSYQIETEAHILTDCAICEAYEHYKITPNVALFGGSSSSYSGRCSVGVVKVHSLEPALTLACGVSFENFCRIAEGLGCLQIQYDSGSSLPPKDEETVLLQCPVRFIRTGKYERNGGRQVYREISTSRFFYVDRGHFGMAAHLEVFNSNEEHIGTANLNGEFDATGRAAGRVIQW